MKLIASRIAVLFSGLLTIVALFCYPYLPSQKVEVLSTNNFSSSLYGFQHSATWINQKNKQWECHFKKGDPRSCGVLISFGSKGLDAKKLRAIEIRAQYGGDAKNVVLFLESSTSPTQQIQTKRMSTTISSSALGEGLSIRKIEFRSKNKRSAHLENDTFNRINNLGIEYLEHGKHQLKLESITLEFDWLQKWEYFFCVAMIWVIFNLSELIVQLNSSKLRTNYENSRVEDLVLEYQKRESSSPAAVLPLFLDPLTGILNRKGIEDLLRRLFCGEYQKHQIGLLLFDLDHFTDINQIRGKNVGDRVLQDVIRIVSENVRGSDILGRWDQEKLLLICPQTQKQHFCVLAEKLRLVLSEYIFEPQSKEPLKITASIGATTCTIENEDFQSIFNRADQALKEAKSKGRNRVVYFGEHPQLKTQDV